jgi:hypothetical protein
MALAQTHTGVIAQIRIDSDVLPHRPLYREMHDVLVRAFEKGMPCTFEWTHVDAMTNRARIESSTCIAQK